MDGLIKQNFGLVYTTLGGLFSNILGALFWLILASILNVENYGQVNYYIAIANVAAGVGTIGLNLTVTTYLAKGDEKLLPEANSLTLLTGVASAIILSAFHWIAAILATTSIFFTMTLAEILGRKNYKEYALISIGQKTVQICLSLLFFYYLGIIGILIGYLLGTLIFSYKFISSILKNFTLSFDNLKGKRNFALHSYGYNLIGKNLAFYLDKLIIGALFGYYSLGVYQLGFQFFMFLAMVPTSIHTYLLPEESSGNHKKEIKILGLLASIGLAIAAYLASPMLIQSFFSSFSDSILLVQIMSFAIIPQTVVSILIANRLGNEKSRIVLISGIIYIVSLVTNILILHQIFGILGFATAIIVAQTIQAICLLINRK